MGQNYSDEEDKLNSLDTGEAIDIDKNVSHPNKAKGQTAKKKKASSTINRLQEKWVKKKFKN